MFDVFTSEVLFYADPLSERLSGKLMSDVSIVIPLKNNSPTDITISPSTLRVIFKDQTEKIFFIDEIHSFANFETEITLASNKKKMIKMKVIVSEEIHNQLQQLHQLWISIDAYPPIGLVCNASQGNWNVISESHTHTGSPLPEEDFFPSKDNNSDQYCLHESNIPGNSVIKEDFRFVCPHCGQHFDCTPDCEGVACECPVCSNTIYPQRPIVPPKVNSTLIISCSFLGNFTQSTSRSSTQINTVTDDTEQLDEVDNCIENVFNEYEDESEDVDWDEIDEAMQSDMDDVLDSIVDDTIYDMPIEASDDFEQAAEDAWISYRASSSFRKEFKEWCEENCYEDEDDFAEDSMKDEWIDEWKSDNEDDWDEKWCEEHIEELKEKWHNEKELEWKKEWASDNASYHDVTVEQILRHWKIVNKQIIPKQEKTSSSAHLNVRSEKENVNNNGEQDMKNKIPVETQFKSVSGNITAVLQGDEIVLYTDLTSSNYSEDKYHYNIAFIGYDEDGDICARQSIGLCWLEEPFPLDIASGTKPVRLIAREENR